MAHSPPISAMAFHPCGSVVAICSNRSAQVRDIIANRKIAKIDTGALISSVAYSDDSKLLAFGHKDGSISLCDTSKNTPIAKLKQHSGIVSALCFDYDSKLLASGDELGVVCLWNMKDHKLIKILPDISPYRLKSIRFSPDGKSLALAYLRLFYGATTAIYDIDANSVNTKATDIGNYALCVNISPAGRPLAVGTMLGVKVFDFIDGTELIDLSVDETISELSFSREGDALIVGTVDGKVLLFSTHKYHKAAETQELNAQLSCMAISPVFPIVTAGSTTGSIAVFKFN